MTHHWPVRDHPKQRGSVASPLSLSPHSKPLQHRFARQPVSDKKNWKVKKMAYVAEALRESPVNSSQDSLSVAPPHFASSWSKPGDKRTHIHPQHGGRAPPSWSVEKKKYDVVDVEALLSSAGGGSPSLSRQASIPAISLFPRWCPCWAELFWSGSDRLLGPFSAAGAAGPDVTAAEFHRGPIGAQEEPPWAESIFHRCTSEEKKGEEERRHGIWKCLRRGGTLFLWRP